ncbi:hypothetical protein Tco_1144804 [Tanacetum coccineum]
MGIHTMIFNITKIPPKRMSTFEAPTLTHATIEELTLIVLSYYAYEKFTSYQLSYFNGTDGAVGLIRWFKQKMEEGISINLVVKGNDLKTYIRRFQELVVLCLNMVPNAEKLMEVFINGLPRSIEGNVTALKPQTLEEAINIAQRLMIKISIDSVQELITIVTTSRYVVSTGRVKVPAGRYVVPTGKDNVIVSAGRTKVIPAGRTILVLVVLCLLRVDSIVS